jgi:hypothetical protein
MDVAVASSTAFVASDPFGLSTVNVSNPAAPGVLGSSDLPFFGQSIAVSGTRAVVTGQTPEGLAHLWVLDVTDTATPTVLGELPTTIPAGSSTGFQRVALNSTGTRRRGDGHADLGHRPEQPCRPVVRGSYDTPGTVNAVALNSTATLAFVADGTGDLQVVDIATPSAPTLLASLPLTGLHVDIALTGPLAYLVNSVGTLTIVNVSTPSAPVFVTSRAPVAGAYGQRIAVEATRAAVLANDATSAWLQSWDLSIPTSPLFLGAVAVGPVGTGKGVALAGGRAYVAANTQGLQIYDLSGSAAPVLLDAVGTVGDALGIVVQSGLAYVADFPATITIIHVP